MDLDLEALRREFPALDAPVHGRRLAYLDSASTSLKPRAVIDAVRRHGRWAGKLSFLRRDGSEGICDTVAVAHNDDYGRAIAIILIHRERPPSHPPEPSKN